MTADASKRLSEPAKNYSITELEMCRLAINITNFAHLLKRVDFDAIVDHLALVHILKSKTEPATARIKRLLEVLSACSFTLYYMKGKDMILIDFLSRQRIDKSNPHEIIPISFGMRAILKDKYCNVEDESRYLVQTCSQVKDRGIKLPDIHSADKGVDPDLKLEWIVRKAQKLVEKSRLEQDREDCSREINTPTEEKTQFTEENNVREQLLPKQREGINVPQVNQNTDKCLKQNKSTMICW